MIQRRSARPDPTGVDTRKHQHGRPHVTLIEGMDMEMLVCAVWGAQFRDIFVELIRDELTIFSLHGRQNQTASVKASCSKCKHMPPRPVAVG